MCMVLIECILQQSITFLKVHISFACFILSKQQERLWCFISPNLFDSYLRLVILLLPDFPFFLLLILALFWLSWPDLSSHSSHGYTERQCYTDRVRGCFLEFQCHHVFIVWPWTQLTRDTWYSVFSMKSCTTQWCFGQWQTPYMMVIQ